MRRMIVACALLAACRGGQHERKDAGLRKDAPASVVSVVPRLPLTEDGARELPALDARIAKAPRPDVLIPLLFERASLRGALEDYTRALDETARYVATTPNEELSWKLRVQALSRVHRVKEARAALEHLRKLAHPSMLVETVAAIDDAAGEADDALAKHAQLAHDAPSSQHLAMYAAALAGVGRYDEALTIMANAAKDIRFNTPVYINWLLFQWGRIYEQKGELAAARDFYLEAHARLPGSVETEEHLALALIGTGDTARAKALVAEAVKTNPHPALLALAGDPRAAAEWDRYVAALPEAFADHAARFYLPTNPKRALELARIDFANRPHRLASRALVVEAALAAGDAKSACDLVEPLAAAPMRADRFTAWKALSACGRKADADRLAAELGI